MKKSRKKRKASVRTDTDLTYLKAGKNAYNEGDNQKALNHFSLISEDSMHFGEACLGRGRALMRMRKWNTALPVLQDAHEKMSHDPEILVDAADSLRMIGEYERSEQLYKTARERGADNYRAEFGVASIFQSRKMWLKAIESWEAMDHSFPANYFILHNLGKAWHEVGETDKSFELLTRSFELSNDESTLMMLAVIAPHAKSASHEKVLQLRSELGKRFGKGGGEELLISSSPKSERINVGYISSFFHRPNWMKPVWALLNNHDREKIKLHLFVDGPVDEAIMAGGYIADERDTIHEISHIPTAELSKFVAKQNIDVLVDLNGYSATSRLSLWATRPARHTVAWFNYYATSGLAKMDWLIGDDIVIHPEEEKHYSEKILRLKQSYLSFQLAYDTPEIEFTPDEEPFCFGCLGSAYKITPAVRNAWIRILKETENTKLLIRNRVLGDESHKQWFLKFFTESGIAKERLVLMGPAEHSEFLKTYGKIDLALDTFPYNGGTTTMESLWQGVPMVCFAGDRWVSRTSATLLHYAGLEEFVGKNENDYAEIAIKWSAPAFAERLSELRGSMRQILTDSIVCDGEQLAKDFEGLIEKIVSG